MLRRMTDYDRKRQAQLLEKVQTPQGGSIPEIERNVTTVGTGQLNVISTPQQLSFVSRKKMAVKLTWLSGTGDVYWSATAGLIGGDSGNGDLLLGVRGSWISIPSPVVIWVACATGNTARISWGEAYYD